MEINMAWYSWKSQAEYTAVHCCLVELGLKNFTAGIADAIEALHLAHLQAFTCLNQLDSFLLHVSTTHGLPWLQECPQPEHWAGYGGQKQTQSIMNEC